LRIPVEYPGQAPSTQGLATTGKVNTDGVTEGVMDKLRDYLAAVTAELGVGLESCCWGSESPAWAYLALDWQVAGHDVALVWDELDGWTAATETGVGCDLAIVAHLDGESAPPPETVAQFVATVKAEALWAVPQPAVPAPAMQAPN
jgi:hypothetical protein